MQARGERDWAVPESHVMPAEGDRELYVGGVHVHIFLKEPNFPLRNPKVNPPPPLPIPPACQALSCPCAQLCRSMTQAAECIAWFASTKRFAH